MDTKQGAPTVTKKYEVFVDGDLTYTTEDKTKAEARGRFFLDHNPSSTVAVREWILSSDEVLQ